MPSRDSASAVSGLVEVTATTADEILYGVSGALSPAVAAARAERTAAHLASRLAEPAFIDEKGNRFWRNAAGQLHRTDGPAVELSDGTREWWLREWYVNGRLHREDGPAVEFSNGTREWWLNDVEVDEETVMGAGR